MSAKQDSITFNLVQLREIAREDDRAVELLVQRVMSEFGCVGSGFSIVDPELQQMYESYSDDKADFYVLEYGHEILGCGGVAPLVGGAVDTCELRKMYFDRRIRGIGWGRKLLTTCLNRAKELGFRHCYLETVRAMDAANRLYQKAGFVELDSSLGATGHTGCDRWYSIDLATW